MSLTDQFIEEAINDLRNGSKTPKVAPTPKEPEKEFLDVEWEAPNSVTSSKTIKYSDITGSVPEGKEDFDVQAFDSSDWDEEGQQNIPEVDENFVWDHDVAYPLLRAYKSNLKVLVVGPTGSGKTEMNRQLCAHVKQPYLRINGRQDMESDTLLGKPWVENGETVFILGELPKALKKGWYIAFDEPWKTPAGIQMSLQRYYERGGVLQLDDMPGDLEDKMIVPDRRSRFVLCDNVVGTGDNMDKFSATMIQDASTINRMDMVLYQGYLAPKEESGMVVKKYPFVPESKADRVIQLASLIRDSFEKGDLAATMSPRNIQSWMEMAYELRNYEEAFKYTMLNRYADDAERDAVIGHYRTVFNRGL